MKSKKEYVVLVLVIVALSAYLVAHKEGSVHYKLPRLEKLNSKNITKLAIKSASSDIALEEKGGKWLILPQGFPAKSEPVETMTEKVSGLTLTALASGAGHDSVYGLDESNAIKVSAYHGDKLLRSFEVGKSASSGRQTFVKLNGDDRVYYADGGIRYPFDKKIGDILDKTVLSFTEDITGMTVERGGSRSGFVKASGPGPKVKGGAGNSAPKWHTVAGAIADGGRIGQIISTLSNLSCDAFVPSKTKEDFKKPAYIVTLTGKKSYSLSLFKKEGDKYPALSSQSNRPFYLRKGQAETLAKDLAALSGTAKKVRSHKGKNG